ncbi:hypothetical protein MNBD_GAMMA12-2682 [hydrothermal vent metagenome]|uniref:DUF2970 domain-containing protein n=1 Tax=hydrothermal vent metagenome TaxID=652676 RepID=A0A3B0YX29_9ZZZZ
MQMNTNENEPQDNSSKPMKVSWWAVIKSVLSAMLGVQSAKNRERDFTQGKAHHYIIIGIIATLLFIFTLVFVVSLVS